MREFWTAVEQLDNEVAADVQLDDADRRPSAGGARDPLAGARQPGRDRHRALTRATSSPARSCLTAALPEVLDGADREAFDVHAHRLREAECPPALARRVAAMPSMLAVFDIVEVAGRRGASRRW